METLKVLRKLVDSYPRANLKLNQVFALDEAKEYLKAHEKQYHSPTWMTVQVAAGSLSPAHSTQGANPLSDMPVGEGD